MQFLVISEATGEITGYQSGGSSPPPDGNGKRYVVASDAEMEAWRRASGLMRQARRKGAPIWVDASREVVIPPDMRPAFRVSTNGAIMDVSDQTPTEITVTAIDEGGALDPRSGSVTLIAGERRIRVDYVDGVGVKQITSSASGVWSIESTPDIRIESPAQIEAVE